VRYQDLTGDLGGTLGRIYEQLRLPGRPPAVLAESEADHRSGHVYTLEEFGLSDSGIRERLAPVFRAYGF